MQTDFHVHVYALKNVNKWIKKILVKTKDFEDLLKHLESIASLRVLETYQNNYCIACPS